jgi:hypothetical protein
MPTTYNDGLDTGHQAYAEQAIAGLILDEFRPRCGEDVEEACAELGRRILLLVLDRFRPDLVEGDDD